MPSAARADRPRPSGRLQHGLAASRCRRRPAPHRPPPARGRACLAAHGHRAGARRAQPAASNTAAHARRRQRRDEMHAPARASAAAARRPQRNRAPSRSTSPMRLPGSTATTVGLGGRPSAAARRCAVGFQRHLVGQRMTDELARAPACRRRHGCLERQQAQHAIDGRARCCARGRGARPTPAGSRTAPCACPRCAAAAPGRD